MTGFWARASRRRQSRCRKMAAPSRKCAFRSPPRKSSSPSPRWSSRPCRLGRQCLRLADAAPVAIAFGGRSVFRALLRPAAAAPPRPVIAGLRRGGFRERRDSHQQPRRRQHGCGQDRACPTGASSSARSCCPTSSRTWRCSRSRTRMRNFQPIEIGDSDAVEVGDLVLAIGNPVRRRPDGDHGHRVGGLAHAGRRQRLSASSSRPTHRSIRAIPAARWSTCKAG